MYITQIFVKIVIFRVHIDTQHINIILFYLFSDVSSLICQTFSLFRHQWAALWLSGSTAESSACPTPGPVPASHEKDPTALPSCPVTPRPCRVCWWSQLLLPWSRDLASFMPAATPPAEQIPTTVKDSEGQHTGQNDSRQTNLKVERLKPAKRQK